MITALNVFVFVRFLYRCFYSNVILFCFAQSIFGYQPAHSVNILTPQEKTTESGHVTTKMKKMKMRIYIYASLYL